MIWSYNEPAVQVYLEDGQCISLEYNEPLELSTTLDPKIVAVIANNHVRNLIVRTHYEPDHKPIRVEYGEATREIISGEANVEVTYRDQLNLLTVSNRSIVHNMRLIEHNPTIDFRMFVPSTISPDRGNLHCMTCNAQLLRRYTHVCYNNIVDERWKS